MSSETTITAEQYCLQKWTTQTRDFQSRPVSIGLRRVGEACLETIQGKMPTQQTVSIQPELLQQQEQKDSNTQAGLDISTKGFSVHVTESTPMSLLAKVLDVIRDAQ